MIDRNTDACTLCMNCVQDCASGVWRNCDGVPAVVAPDLCNRCGHCMAVCPAGAVIHDRLKQDMMHRVDRKMINAGVYREIAGSRRSMRHFKEREVPEGVIEDVITLAGFSPTASNDQNVGYTVVTDREIIRGLSHRMFIISRRFYQFSQSLPGKFLVKITGAQNSRYLNLMEYVIELTESGRDMFLHNAPVLILLHAPARAGFAEANCNLAAMNLMNYAWSRGLGTCYIGFMVIAIRLLRSIKKQLNVPSGRKVFAALVMGYPDIRHPRTVSRKQPDITWMS